MSDAVKQNDRTIATGRSRTGGRSRCSLKRPTEILLGFIAFVMLFYVVIFKSGFARCVLRSFLAFPARRHANAWMPQAALARAGTITDLTQIIGADRRVWKGADGPRGVTSTARPCA